MRLDGTGVGPALLFLLSFLSSFLSVSRGTQLRSTFSLRYDRKEWGENDLIVLTSYARGIQQGHISSELHTFQKLIRLRRATTPQAAHATS